MHEVFPTTSHVPRRLLERGYLDLNRRVAAYGFKVCGR
jgi:hypothetical protein